MKMLNDGSKCFGKRLKGLNPGSGMPNLASISGINKKLNCQHRNHLIN